MKKVFVLTITGLLLSSFLFSQKKYPSLLWEISGNGLKEKSYLYGTMHVSEKIAFNLSDIFFEKLYSVKQVALESDPNLWLDDMKNTENYDYYHDYDYYDDYNSYKYSSLYLNPIQPKTYKDALRVNDYLTDGILYRRYGSSTQNFQENTYLDMFIYRSAKKLGKKFHGLEDVKESRKIMEKAYQSGDDYYDGYYSTKKPWLKKMLKGQPVRTVMEDAYRKQDLDLIDSLQKGYYPPNVLKYSLHVRNENMVKSMDSLMKKGSLFSAVGAAHLGGKKGIIELLRAKGYKVEPLTSAYTEKGRKQKENIDNLIYNQSLSTQNNYDGFSIKSPNKFFNFSQKQTNYLVSLDIPNGAFLSLTKLSHFDFLTKSSYRPSVQSIDSLLYENIPGKILTKKHFTKDGFPGIEVTSRSDNDEYLDTQIFLTPLETYIFNLNGTKNYGTKYKNTIFSSLKLKPISGTFSNYSPKSGGYAVNLPDYRISSDTLSSSPSVIAYDKNSDSYYFINVQTMDMISPEKEEYELQRIPYEFIRNLDIKGFETVSIDDTVPYSETTASLADNKKLYLKTIINGASYNLIGIVTQNENIKTRFFNSFKLKDIISYKKPEKYENKKAGYSINLPFKPQEDQKNKWEEITAPIMADSTAVGETPSYNPDDHYDYYPTDDSASYNLENNQKISIVYYSPYLESDSLKAEDIIKDHIKNQYESDSCSVSKIRFIQNGTSDNGYFFSDYVLENENAAQTHKLRYYYQNDKVYEIKYIINKHQEYNNPSANEIYNNILFFKPEKEKTEDTEKDENIDVSDEINSDEESTDVEKPESQISDDEPDYYSDEYKIEEDSMIWTAIDKKNQPVLNKIKAISTDYKKVENFMLSYPSDSLNQEILNAAIQTLDYHKQTKSDFYEKLYPKFKNNGDSQLSILTKIVEIDSEKGIKKAISMIKKELPIPSSESAVYSFFNTCSYHTETSENYLLPGILNYSSVDEYYNPIMSYLSDLESEDKLKAKHVKKYKNYFLNEVKNNFKRFLTQSGNTDSYYSDYSSPLEDLKENLNILSLVDDSGYQKLVSEIRKTRKPELLAVLAKLKKPVELTQEEYISLTKETIPSKELNKAYKDKFGKDIFDPEKDLTADMAKKILLKNNEDRYYDYYSDSSKDSLTLKEEKIIASDTKKYKVYYFTITRNKNTEDSSYSENKKKDKKDAVKEEKTKEEYNGTDLAAIVFDLTKEKEDDEKNECSDYNNSSYDYSYDQSYYDESSLAKIVYLSTELSYYDDDDWNELDRNLTDYLTNKEHPRATTKFNENSYYDYYY